MNDVIRNAIISNVLDGYHTEHITGLSPAKLLSVARDELAPWTGLFPVPDHGRIAERWEAARMTGAGMLHGMSDDLEKDDGYNFENSVFSVICNAYHASNPEASNWYFDASDSQRRTCSLLVLADFRKRHNGMTPNEWRHDQRHSYLAGLNADEVVTYGLTHARGEVCERFGITQHEYSRIWREHVPMGKREFLQRRQDQLDGLVKLVGSLRDGLDGNDAHDAALARDFVSDAMALLDDGSVGDEGSEDDDGRDGAA